LVDLNAIYRLVSSGLLFGPPCILGQT